MRQKFTLTDAQYNALLIACTPVPRIDENGFMCARADVERVNAAWIALGDELGFDAGTVMPLETERDFSADVIEKAQRAD